MRTIAGFTIVIAVLLGVGTYVGVNSFQVEETPTEPFTALTPGASPPPGVDPDIAPLPCPECFPPLPPGPEPFRPCEDEDTTLPLPDYSSLAKPDTSDWKRYESLNYPWSFLYPPEWKIEVEHAYVYGEVKIPTELIKLWDPTVMSHRNDIHAPGGVRITIDHGPGAAGTACGGSGRYEKVDVSLAGKPTLVVMEAGYVPGVEDIFFTIYAGIRVSDDAFVHFVLETYSPSHLATMRALLESMTYGTGG